MSFASNPGSLSNSLSSSSPNSSSGPNSSRHLLCTQDEFLLFIDQFDCQFTHEAELRPMDMDEAVNECEDTTLRIIRMDHSNWRGEDITEEIADEWLNIHEPEPDSESTLPDFVRNSEAWLDYLDEYDDIDTADAPELTDFDLGVGRYAS